MNKYFWKSLFFLKIHPNSLLVNKVAKIILENNDWKIEDDEYYIYLKNKRYKITAWNTGKMYAWFGRGEIKLVKSKTVFRWDNKMPSNHLLFKLHDYIDEQQFKELTKEDVE